MLRFEPTWEELELYKDGGVAIIDQWICAHARSAPPGLLRLSRPRPPAPGGRLPSGDVGALGLVRLSAWDDSLCFQMLRHAGVWAWAPVLQVAGARPEKGPGRGPVLLRS